MKRNLIDRIREGNIYYGLDIVAENNGTAHNLVSVKRKGGEIDLLTSETFATLSEAVRTVPKLSPVSLVLRTDQVVTKIGEPSGMGKKKGIGDLFPSVTDDGFYWELLEGKDAVHGGICRRGAIDSLVSELAPKKIFICAWSLGGTSVETLPDGLRGEYLSLAGDDQVLSTNGLAIKGRYVPAFSGALNLASGFAPGQNNYGGEQRANLEGLWGHRYFKLGLACATTLVLALLLCNFLVFDHYFNRVNELRGLSQLNTDQKGSLLDLAAEVGRKEKMIGDVLRSSSRASYYMDQIAGGIPENIMLQKLDYQPLLKAIKEGEPLELGSDHILITGDYNDNLALSGWIADLEGLGFVDTVTITSLEKNESVPAFELDVELIAEE